MSFNENTAFMSFTRGQMLLDDLVVLSKFSLGRKLIVELGTCTGIGAIALSACGSSRVFTVDNYLQLLISGEVQNLDTPFKRSDIVKAFLKMFYNIEVINSSTIEASNLFVDESIDLLYIDADHDYQSVKNDYNAWFPKVIYGGIILFHDYSDVHPGVKGFIDNEIKNDIDLGIVEKIPIDKGSVIFGIKKERNK